MSFNDSAVTKVLATEYDVIKDFTLCVCDCNCNYWFYSTNVLLVSVCVCMITRWLFILRDDSKLYYHLRMIMYLTVQNKG